MEEKLAIYNFPKLYKETTFNGLNFSIEKNKKALDLTDAIIVLEIISSGMVVCEWTSTNGYITITDAKKGKFEINSFIVDILEGSYNYVIKFKIENEIFPYIKGKIVVEDLAK